MTHGHTFWFLILGACVVWYSTITIYVAIKGSLDIRKMLEDLRRRDDTAKSREPEQITNLSNTKPTNKKP